MNSLTLTFVESYVTKVEIVNVDGAVYQARLSGAKVMIGDGGDDPTVCGTITNTSAGRELTIHCNAAGSSVVIELEKQPLHVAEVKIYGRGKEFKILYKIY